MSGSLKVGIRSPSLEEQFDALSLTREIPSPLSQAPVQVPQYVVYSPKVMEYFAEQRRIGAQLPRNPYPMKYDISVYRLADVGMEKCFASVDSKDWRQRELSIRATDEAIDFIKEVLRQPITEAGKKAFEGVTPKNMKEKWAANYVNTSFHDREILDFPRANPAETKSEKALFTIHPTAKTVLLSVPKAKIQEIGLKVLSFAKPKPDQNPGPVLFTETTKRVWNIVEKMFQPELACMRWLEKSDINPSAVIFNGTTQSFNEGHLYNHLALELCRRLRRTDMSPRLVDSIIEACLREEKSVRMIHSVAERIEKGIIPDRFTLSW